MKILSCPQTIEIGSEQLSKHKNTTFIPKIHKYKNHIDPTNHTSTQQRPPKSKTRKLTPRIRALVPFANPEISRNPRGTADAQFAQHLTRINKRDSLSRVPISGGSRDRSRRRPRPDLWPFVAINRDGCEFRRCFRQLEAAWKISCWSAER